ncbi:uncharacterized protein LOC132760486 [Ruditapes philippinarum]|uniref:uncharacterized protein LOC132760486 n=1 Tax=Ruditapes philippinarum TaxID=129788 RepID=UPI00295BB067|nr:uncharacterized protein LOC132760486 [Ruditapes philippinarum]
MRYFKFASCILSATLFSQISTRHLSKDGKLFYVSEPAKKLDHVTSKEECISHSGSLLHADALTTGTKFQDIENFNLSANTSYWLEGSAPYLTNSCLLLSNTSTVMAAGCAQLHGYICELSLGFTPTMSATKLSHIPLSSIFETTSAPVISKGNLPAFTIQPSFFSSVQHPHLLTSLNFVSGAESISLTLQKSFTSITYSNISPTKVQTIFEHSLHDNTSTVSQHGPYPDTTASTSGDKSTIQHHNCSVYCLKLFSSLTVAELIRIMRNVSISDTIVNSGQLNESLVVNAKETGRAKRKLTSAADSRYSSKAIGGLAVVIITLVPVCFILIDLPNLLRHLKYFKSKQKR